MFCHIIRLWSKNGPTGIWLRNPNLACNFCKTNILYLFWLCTDLNQYFVLLENDYKRCLNIYSRFQLIEAYQLPTICLNKMAAPIIKNNANDSFRFCFCHFVSLWWLPQLNGVPNNRNLLCLYVNVSILPYIECLLIT